MRLLVLLSVAAGVLLLARPVFAQYPEACLPDPHPTYEPVPVSAPHVWDRVEGLPCAARVEDFDWDRAAEVWTSTHVVFSGEYDDQSRLIRRVDDYDGVAFAYAYEYDPAGRLARERTIDRETGEPSGYAQYTYDAQNRLLVEEKGTRQDGEQTASRRIRYSYQVDPAATVRTTDVRVEDVWITTHRRTSTFDAGRLTTTVSEAIDDLVEANDTLRARTRVSFTYDATGRLTEKLSESFDPETGSFSPSTRSSYTYEAGPSGAASFEFQRWVADRWRDEARADYDYDTEGRVIQLVIFEWLESSIELDRRYRYSYNDQGFVARESLDRYLNGSWVSRSRTEYARDEHQRVTERRTSAWRDGAWVNSGSRRYTYPSTVAAEPGLPEAAALAAAPYPNPTAGPATLPLNLAAPVEVRAEVLDLLGRRVAEVPATARGAGPQRLALPTDGLAPGAYLVRVTVGAATTTRRLTVVR